MAPADVRSLSKCCASNGMCRYNRCTPAAGAAVLMKGLVEGGVGAEPTTVSAALKNGFVDRFAVAAILLSQRQTLQTAQQLLVLATKTSRDQARDDQAISLFRAGFGFVAHRGKDFFGRFKDGLRRTRRDSVGQGAVRLLP